MTCEVCRTEIAQFGTFSERCARVERGNFTVSGDEDRNWDNVKFGIYICQRCFMEDSDLCAFFNKLDMRIR